MQQLNLFDTPNLKPPVKIKLGRPNKVTPEIVFNVVDAIKRNKSNKNIISEFNLTERTFFRIKKGEYTHLLVEALEDASNEFSLSLSE